MMIRTKFFICILLLYLFPLVACSPSSKDISSTRNLPSSDSLYISENIKNSETINETEYYKVIYSDFMYYYYIFDENHDVVMSEGPLNKQPDISTVNDNLIKITLQAGTGIGTQWGFFYDIKADVFSRRFQCIYDQWNGKVAYGDLEKVIVRDIFDKTLYYQEISSFKEPFSKVAEPITNARFVNDGTGIEVSYLTGTDYKEVVEMIELN